MPGKTTLLPKYTYETIHTTIRTSSTILDAANKLDVSYDTLKRHLEKFFYINKPLSYLVMKNISPAEARAYWGDTYTQPMQPKNVKINNFSLAEIHKVIIESLNSIEAAAKLEVQERVLKRYLERFYHQDKPLTFAVLKSLTPAAAKEFWQQAYLKTNYLSKSNLAEYTIREIHSVILSFDYISHAANILGVTSPTLKLHLAKFTHNNQILTFELMKTISVADAANFWRDSYDKLMEAPKIELNKYSIKLIHETIKYADSVYAAAISLGVKSDTLTRHLERFRYREQVLSCWLMKSLSFHDAAQFWGEAYFKPMQIDTLIAKQSPTMEQKIITPMAAIILTGNAAIASPTINKPKMEFPTLEVIHELVINSNSLADAATMLEMGDYTLARLLARFTYQNEVLTYKTLRGLSPDIAKLCWGDAYTEPLMPQKIKLADIPIEKIHQVIHASRNISVAANTLGVEFHSINRYLGKFIHQGEILSYKIMKRISEAEAIQAVQDYFSRDTHAGKISLDDYTAREIHEVILTSRNITNAAVNLHTHIPILQRFLERFHYHTQDFNYDYLKSVSREVAIARWGEAYDEPMKTNKINMGDYSLRQIHLRIRSSRGLKHAAQLLTMTPLNLINQLKKFKYLNQNLSFEKIRSLTPTHARVFWDMEYDLALANTEAKKPDNTVVQAQVLLAASTPKLARTLSNPEESPSKKIRTVDIPGDKVTDEFISDVVTNASFEENTLPAEGIFMPLSPTSLMTFEAGADDLLRTHSNISTTDSQKELSADILTRQISASSSTDMLSPRSSYSFFGFPYSQATNLMSPRNADEKLDATVEQQYPAEYSSTYRSPF